MLKIALVGRPNVGKSALFNRICKERKAIVAPQEGVTRDRLYAQAECFGQPFTIIDTGGMVVGARASFQQAVMAQAHAAIAEADVLVMVVDARVGVATMDERVGALLRQAKKPLLLAINKVDDRAQLDAIYPFNALGFERVMGVSAMHNFQIAELLQEALRAGEHAQVAETARDAVRVAIVGRANVGKSTLINALLKEERCVVSPLPGTTRDAIDTHVVADGVPYTLIDTAGLRRKKAEGECVEKFAAIRTEEAMERADVCVLVLDAARGITTFEKRIAESIESNGKGCVLAFNKWDLVKGVRMEHCKKSFAIDVPFLEHCPVLFTSGQTGRALEGLFPAIRAVHAARTLRITTGQLNRLLEKAMQTYHPPMIAGKRLRIYYLAQVGVAPPHFVLFVNNAKLMPEAYRKYLVHQLRKAHGFVGVPLRFSLRSKRRIA